MKVTVKLIKAETLQIVVEASSKEEAIKIIQESIDNEDISEESLIWVESLGWKIVGAYNYEDTQRS